MKINYGFGDEVNLEFLDSQIQSKESLFWILL